jgi:hypothetical protein
MPKAASYCADIVPIPGSGSGEGEGAADGVGAGDTTTSIVGAGEAAAETESVTALCPEHPAAAASAHTRSKAKALFLINMPVSFPGQNPDGPGSLYAYACHIMQISGVLGPAGYFRLFTFFLYADTAV